MKKKQTLYTISALARLFGRSRSTLLYYDSIGLLRPSGRGGNNYRLYTEADRQRLEQICKFRKTGMPLKEIVRVLDNSQSVLTKALEGRLEELNHEIEKLRQQQRIILGILKKGDARKKRLPLSKEGWVEILASAGFDGDDMDLWHAEFERQNPERHQAFLELLNIDPKEIKLIRRYSRRARKDRNKS